MNFEVKYSEILGLGPSLIEASEFDYLEIVRYLFDEEG
jgi:hypothetical protein